MGVFANIMTRWIGSEVRKENKVRETLMAGQATLQLEVAFKYLVESWFHCMNINKEPKKKTQKNQPTFCVYVCVSFSIFPSSSLSFLFL